MRARVEKVTVLGWNKSYTKALICTNIYSKAPLGQIVEFGTIKSMSVPTNKNIAAEIVPHISSALRDLGVIFENIYLI